MTKTFERVAIAFMLVVGLWVVWNLTERTFLTILAAHRQVAELQQQLGVCRAGQK